MLRRRGDAGLQTMVFGFGFRRAVQAPSWLDQRSAAADAKSPRRGWKRILLFGLLGLGSASVYCERTPLIYESVVRVHLAPPLAIERFIPMSEIALPMDQLVLGGGTVCGLLLGYLLFVVRRRQQRRRQKAEQFDLPAGYPRLASLPGGSPIARPGYKPIPHEMQTGIGILLAIVLLATGCAFQTRKQPASINKAQLSTGTRTNP